MAQSVYDYIKNRYSPDDTDTQAIIKTAQSLSPAYQFIAKPVLDFIGGEQTQDSIQPEGSPIDFVAGAAGASLGSAMARDAGSILGNEIGAVGSKASQLPMDEAARMARAKEMGFDTGKMYYHGTTSPNDFEEFNLANGAYGKGIYFADTPKVADIYNSSQQVAEGRSTVTSSRTLPVYLKDKMYTYEDSPNGMQKVAKDLGFKSYEDLDNYFRTAPSYSNEDAFNELLKQQGYIGKIAKNPIPQDAKGTLVEQAIVFDPSAIRSKFAAFDPKKAKSGNLSAGIAGTAIGAGLLAGNESQASEKPPMGLKLSQLDPKDVQFMGTGAQIGRNAPSTGGLKLSDFHPSEIEHVDPDVDPKTSQVTAATTGLVQGAVPFASSIAGVGRAAMNAITGTKGPLAGGSLDDVVEDYRQGRDQFQNDAKTSAAANPWTAGGMNLVGATQNPLFKFAPGPTSSLAGRAAYAGMDTVAPAASKLALAGKLTGASAIQGLGTSDADLTKGEVLPAAIDTGLGAAGGALGYGVGALGAKALSKLGPVADYILKKTGKIFGSVPEEYTSEYLARKGKVEARPSDEIMNEINQIHNDRQYKVDQTNRNVVRNQDNVDRVNQDLKNQMADVKFKTNQDYSQANQDYQNAARGIQENLQGKNLTGMKDALIDSIKTLKDRVVSGSADAYAILGDAEGSVALHPVIRVLNRGMSDLKVNGQPVSDSASSSLKNLEALKERLLGVGKELTLPQAKAVIQQLDKDISYGGPAGEFYPEAQAVKRQMRQAFDEVIKTKSPEYAKAMEGVAEDSKLLSEVSDLFGTDAKAISGLNQISSERGKTLSAPLLKRLGEKTGKNFSTPIDEYIGTQDTLQTPSKMKALKEGTPEYARMRALEEKQNTLSNPATKREIQGYKGAEQEELDKAIAAHAKAQEEFEPVRKFGQGSVQAKMKALTGARNYDATKLFEDLDASTGRPFSKEVKDRAILDAFTKSDANGSRKTLLGKAVGTAVGGALGYGEGHDKKSAALGAMIGFGLDKYSGQVIKALLDGRIAAAQAKQLVGNKLGKYAPVIIDSVNRGPEAMAVTGAMLARDPEFKKRMGVK